ncbi:putative repeat protein (TIGR03943 family) [Paenibacillus cellulosilyticus]|uniref:Putative repeat protein (TIGR03943 family) n=1 Tax=Paenibacillus cellulosilyticus TaxID=375489 RepID=A0A2V2YSE6_9BACL|nr:TIGR03943 family protein [Paenibacillus cellulosilyticus]PWV98507.1 putative repeat protein (TIGR03943 family) [Paenibacillus cellulosilyticus]QKS44116.1 TIGR03943 family protein [Paenibacillus cellulosilyticus]
MSRWKPAHAEAFDHAFRGVILIGFAALIIILWQTGDMLLYIAPNVVPYVVAASVVLLVLAVSQFRLAALSLWQRVIVCDCGHEHESDNADHNHERSNRLLRKVGVYGLFLLPLLLSAALPSTAFAGSLAVNKGMNMGASVPIDDGKADMELVELEGNVDPGLKELFRTQPYNLDYAKLGMLLYQQDTIEMKDQWFIEKLEAINRFVDNFQGKTITITGFVYRDKQLAGGQLIVGRMAMTHCIADIAPYGMIVELPDADAYPDDAWITVTGTIGKTQLGERQIMKIVATSIEEAQPSAVPYVYPDNDFASKI